MTQSYEDNDGGEWLYINLYFVDGTNFSMDFSLNNPAIVPIIIEYGDVSTGDYPSGILIGIAPKNSSAWKIDLTPGANIRDIDGDL